MKNCLLMLMCFLLLSCDEEIPENKELGKKLVGEWRSLSVKIKMNTYKNRDTIKLFEVLANDWEDVMNIRPIRTFYNSDGTYSAQHYNLKDSLIFNPAGRWKIIGDSLQMTDTFPARGQTYVYQLLIKNNLAELNSIEDCDGDGLKDDEYSGQQWKELPH